MAIFSIRSIRNFLQCINHANPLVRKCKSAFGTCYSPKLVRISLGSNIHIGWCKLTEAFISICYCRSIVKAKTYQHWPPSIDLTEVNIASMESGLLHFWLTYLTIANAASLLPSSACLAWVDTTERISLAYLLKSRLINFNRTPTDSMTSSGFRFSILTDVGRIMFLKSSCETRVNNGTKASLRIFDGFSFAFKIALTYISRNTSCGPKETVRHALGQNQKSIETPVSK